MKQVSLTKSARILVMSHAFIGIVCCMAYYRSGYADSVFEDKHLTCQLEQVLSFGEFPDSEHGPVYLGTKDGKGLDLRSKGNVDDYELDIQDGADRFTTRNYNISFDVDTITGKIITDPSNILHSYMFGGIRLNDIYPKIFSPGMKTAYDAYYSVGYFSKSTKNLVALLMVHPTRRGVRIFSFLDLGGQIFGYCVGQHK